MPVSVPELETLYPGASEDTRVEKFEALKGAFVRNIDRCEKRYRNGYRWSNADRSIVKMAEGVDDDKPDFALMRGQLDKAASADLRASLTASIDQLEKDWTTSNPLSVQPFAGMDMGLVPFDLEPDLLMLLPRWLELRGSIPRTQGVGTAVTYRRLLGVTDTGTGGVADTSPFFNSETVSTSFGSLSLARPPKISYAADAQTRPYVEQGRSDEVTYKQQFSGRGYVDTKALSHIAVTLSDMSAEEKALLNSRGQDTNSLYVGKLNMASPAVTCTSVVATGVGDITAATYTTHMTLFSSVGEVVPIAGANVTTTGSNLGVTWTLSSIPAGTLGVYTYLTTGGVTHRSGPFPATPFLGAGYTQLHIGTVATLPTLDASAYGVSGGTYTAEGYDGLVAIFTDPNQSGYIGRIDGALNTSTIGTEWQQAFSSLWGSVLADPEEVLVTGVIRGRLFELVQAAGSSTAFRINYDQNNGNIGGFVSGMANQITGKMVKLDVHPYLPSGVSLIRSMTLPNLGASGITNIEEVSNVVDLTLFDWPEIQMTKDVSTYKYGTFKHYAPAWCGALVGITDSI